MVTGDYSRGASGFWIENGERSLSGERGDDRRQSARHVPHADAGQRPRIPLRHQRADGARGGADRCRTSEPAPIASATCGRLGSAVREAGALALEPFGGSLKSWTKGRQFAGQRSRHRGRRPAARTAHGGRPDYGWLSEETRGRSGAARRPPRLGGRSDRRHARLSSPAARTGRSRRRWSRTAGRCSRRSMRRSTDEMFLADARRRRDAQRRADRAPARAAASTARASPAQARAGAARGAGAGIVAICRGCIAGVAAGARGAGRARCRLRRRQRPRLGPCGCRSFGARSRRRDDRRLTGSRWSTIGPSRCTAR